MYVHTQFEVIDHLINMVQITQKFNTTRVSQEHALSGLACTLVWPDCFHV